MLLCKDFCDLSSDLPNRDYQRICNFLKDTTEAIRNGKMISIMELSQLAASKQQEHETIAIHTKKKTQKIFHLKRHLHVRELSFSEGELCSEDELQRKFETLNYPEIKDSLAEDAHDIATKEVVQEVVQKEISPNENITPTDTKPNENITPTDTKTVTIEILNTGSTATADEPSSSFSYMTKLSNQKLEVLKNVQIKKKCKQRGRPSRKRAALSFVSAAKGNKNCKKSKKDPSCEKSDSLGIPKYTVGGKLTLSDQQARKNEHDIKSSVNNSLQLIEDGDWLDDQTINSTLDNLKNQFPSLKGIHNTLLGATLSFPVTDRTIFCSNITCS